MRILEILSENDLATQIAKDSELMATAMRQRWEAEQRAKQQPAAPQAPAATQAPATPAVTVTPEMIAKHPQYKAYYDKYLAIELPKSTFPAQAAEQAKKYTDSKIGSLIRQGK